MNKQIFEEILAQYASCEPKIFLELHCYKPENHDDYINSDEDGDVLRARGTIELMDGNNIRVLIPHNTDVKVAARQLKKVAKWLKDSPELIELANIELPNEDDLPF